jgi:hypothetical protein
MANRREFLQAGAAASIVTGIALQADAALPDNEPAAAAAASMPIHEAIYDRRFPESREFASESQRLGVPVHAIEHDITQLWLRDLLPRWRQQRVAVTGLTSECSFQCLQWLAWDLGVRTLYHGEHLFQSNRTVRHTFNAAPAQLDQTRALQADPAAWGRQVAQLLAARPAPETSSSATRQIVTLEGQSTVSRELEEVLISWVLAPVARKTGPYG